MKAISHRHHLLPLKSTFRNTRSDSKTKKDMRKNEVRVRYWTITLIRTCYWLVFGVGN